MFAFCSSFSKPISVTTDLSSVELNLLNADCFAGQILRACLRSCKEKTINVLCRQKIYFVKEYFQLRNVGYVAWVCIRAKRLIRTELIPVSSSWEWLGEFLLPPGWDASPSQGYPPTLYSLVPIYTPGWREAPWECLAHEHNAMALARARTRTARSGVERINHSATVPPRGVIRERSEIGPHTEIQFERWVFCKLKVPLNQ